MCTAPIGTNPTISSFGVLKISTGKQAMFRGGSLGLCVQNLQFDVLTGLCG